MWITILSSNRVKKLVSVFAATVARDISKKMVRVSSSNIWSIGFDPSDNKTGKLVIQFKSDKGGPGDIYLYYDIPNLIYRKMITAPSKGHAFWTLIRNRYKYSKLTGDKKAKTPLGV